MISRFAEYSFLCKNSHVTRSWQWNSVQRVHCSSKGCRAYSYRVISRLHKTSSEPTVYYTSPSGEFFIPGDPTSTRIPPNYTRHEIKTFRDRDSFYKRANLSERIEHEQLSETEEIVFGVLRDRERGDLRQEMQQMSTRGRDLARAAIERTNLSRNRSYESMVYLDGWENDHGR